MSIGSNKTLIISVMRNEGPYILEWLAHHFSLGIDDLLIFTNHCTDNTDRILDRLEELMPHRVKHQPNPKIMFPDRGKWHIMALRYACNFGRYKAADWVYVTDADEFLVFHGDIRTLDDFFEHTGPADAVSFTSVPFNSNGHRHAARALTTTRFTQMRRDFTREAEQGKSALTAVKTLYKNDIIGPRRPHRPNTLDFSTTGKRWINGSGAQLPPEWTDGDTKAIEGVTSRQFGQINHYSIKSAAEFLLKVDRGDAVNAERLGASLNYWSGANISEGAQTSGNVLSKDGHALLDYFLSDPQLQELHEESFTLREAQLAKIIQTPKGEELAQQIGYFG